MTRSNHLLEIFTHLSKDENLLRLLYYPSKHLFDDPLDPEKENILDMGDTTIIADRIKFTENVSGFDKNKMCRICFYSGNRRQGSQNNYSINQNVIFDVLVHRSFQESSLRMEKILDCLDNILLKRRFSSFGKVREIDGHPIGKVAEDYFGYRVIYNFGEFYDK